MHRKLMRMGSILLVTTLLFSSVSFAADSSIEDPLSPGNAAANEEEALIEENQYAAGADADEAADTSVQAGDEADDPLYYEQDEDSLSIYSDAQEFDLSTTSTVNPYTGDYYTYPTCTDGQEIHYGIDVSKWNGTIDYNAVKAAGIEYVYVRIGFSGLATGTRTEDPMWRTNVENALAAGLKVGCYYYSQATTVTKARQEANFMINLIKDYRIDMELVYDAEESNYTENGTSYPGVLKKAALTRNQFTTVAEAFCDCVADAGYKPMIYGSVAKITPASSVYRRLEYSALNQKYAIWLAKYGSAANHVGQTAHTYALQSASANYLTLTRVDGWQYSAVGKVNGISTDTDVNVYFGELPDAGEHTHSFVETGGTASTCSTHGIVNYACECGAHYNWFRDLDPTAHTFKNYVVTTAAVGDTPSILTGTCACGATDTKEGGLVENPKLRLNATNMRLQVGQKTTKFTATIAENDGIKSWKSSNTNIFKVVGKLNGTCAIRAQKKTGKAYLTVTTYSGITKKIPIVVQKGKVACTSLANLPSKVTVQKGSTYQLSPVKRPMTCLTKITYSSAAKSIATVTSTGKIKGIKKGTTTIKVVCGTKSYRVKVTVK